MLTVNAMTDHVYDLAKKHRINLVLVSHEEMPPDRACAVPDMRTVIAGRIIDETTYAAALHEMGHLVAPGGDRRKDFSPQMLTTGQPTTKRDVEAKLHAEIQAWRWAMRNALEWTVAMTHVRQLTFGTYLKDARRYGVKI